MALIERLKLRTQLLTVIFLLAILAAVGVLIGLRGIDTYHDAVVDVTNASSRAIIGEKVNGQIYAVVMESRGVYMSDNTATIERYGKNLYSHLEQLQLLMAEWEELMPKDRVAELNEAKKEVETFVNFRTELVRLALREGAPAGRAYGDNDANRSNRQALNVQVSKLAESNAAEIHDKLIELDDVYKNIFLVSMLILVLGVPLSLLMALIVSGVGILRPLRNMTQTMLTLASGDTSVAVPGLNFKNEIGEMAGAVDVFRQSLIDTARLNTEQQNAQQAQAKRVLTMDNLINTFDNDVKDALRLIAAASTELEATAQGLSSTAEQSSQSAASVAAASEEAAANVQMVARAGTEMNSTTQDIIVRVHESQKRADEAVQEANQAVEMTSSLISAARQIDEVVVMIQEIAAQTNLLALNATIEAARAGDAGKGFSVVANEVKHLAEQTAQATDQIARQVVSVQSASRSVSDAIGKITGIIGGIHESSAAIAQAMQGQGALTNEIAHNIQEAAQGTDEVSLNIAQVSEASNQTGESARQLLDASKELSSKSVVLSAQVETFLSEIKST